jgi:hypothetical protein
LFRNKPFVGRNFSSARGGIDRAGFADYAGAVFHAVACDAPPTAGY